nr:immunoglobulin light chain junction region [Macaca mulatta]
DYFCQSYDSRLSAVLF